MGGKPDNAMASNRPESGGADKDMAREKSGLLERDKQKFAEGAAEKRAEGAGEDGPNSTDQHEPFSTGSPRNMNPDK